jgi:hypothetical protein
LQREHGIGEGIAACQLFAQDAQIPRFDLLTNAAELPRRSMPQKSCCTKYLNQASRAPLKITFGVVTGQQIVVSPTPDLDLQTNMIVSEER